MRKGLVAILVAGVIAAGVGVAMVLSRHAPNGAPAGGIAIGGPFTLVDGAGKTVTDRDFRGRFMVIYFGYTHCPDACPTTLSDLAAAMDKLPQADKAQIVPIFITVDPDRDTAPVMDDYAHAFGPEFVGLSGTKAELDAAEQEFHVYAARHDLPRGGYAMDHSSVIYVMGPDGNFVGIINDQSSPGEIAAQLRKFGA